MAAIYFDDIEKFGIWPETYDWVYNRGWLKALIEGVLASPKIRTATYADFHAREATRGIVYLPTTSYSEMNEWTLPIPAAGISSALLASEKAAGRGDLHPPFRRGGPWRNLLPPHPEANSNHPPRPPPPPRPRHPTAAAGRPPPGRRPPRPPPPPPDGPPPRCGPRCRPPPRPPRPPPGCPPRPAHRAAPPTLRAVAPHPASRCSFHTGHPAGRAGGHSGSKRPTTGPDMSALTKHRV